MPGRHIRRLGPGAPKRERNAVLAVRTCTNHQSPALLLGAVPCYPRVRGGHRGGDPSMACKGSGVQSPQLHHHIAAARRSVRLVRGASCPCRIARFVPPACHSVLTVGALGQGRGGLDQLVQGGRDGGVPASQDVLVTQGGRRGGVPQPGHQLPRARPGGDRQGGRGVPQVMEAKPCQAGCSGGWPPHPPVEVAAAEQSTLVGDEAAMCGQVAGVERASTGLAWVWRGRA